MALICISPLGRHLSVISQRLVTLTSVLFKSLTQLFGLVSPSLLLNTGVPSECTQSSVMLHGSTEVTTEK